MSRSNPVQAFMQGFAVVDNLERNRENRAIQRENQSRTREIWQRQDEEYYRALKQRQQKDDAVAIDNHFAATMDRKFAEYKDLEQRIQNGESSNEILARSNELALALSNETLVDGKLAGRALVLQEVINTMGARDPEFYERVALAGKRDAADGPLIKDKSKPITGIGVVPPGLVPGAEGMGSLVIEVNALGGPAPFTDNRTANANDPISMIEINSEFMVNLLGASYQDPNSQLNIVKFIQSQLDPAAAQEPALKGDGKNTAPGAKPAEPGQTFAHEPEVRGDGILEQNAAAAAADDAVSVGNAPDLPTMTPEDRAVHDEELGITPPSADGRRVTPDEDTIAQQGQTAADNFAATVEADIIAGTKPDTKAAIRGWASALSSDNIDREAFGTTTKPYKSGASASDLRQSGVPPEVTSNAKRASFEDGDEATAKVVGNVPLPGSNDELKQHAGDLVTASNSRRKTPNLAELTQTASFVKMGYITMDQARRFSNTGSYDAPALRKLEKVTTDGITTILDMTGDAAGQGRVAGRVKTGESTAEKALIKAGIDSLKPVDQFKLRKDQLAFLENDPYYARDEKNGKSRANETLDAYNLTATTTGLAASSKSGQELGVQPFDQSDTVDLARVPDAAKWQNGFEEPTYLQKYDDFNSKFLGGKGSALNKLSPVHHLNNFLRADIGHSDVTLGMLAQRHGVTNQRQFNEYATTYGLKYGQWAETQHVPAARRILDIYYIEQFAQEQIRTKGNDLSMAEIREELLEDFVVDPDSLTDTFSGR